MKQTSDAPWAINPRLILEFNCLEIISVERKDADSRIFIHKSSLKDCRVCPSNVAY